MAFRSDRHLATLSSATAQRLEAFSLTSSRCAAHIMARATIRTRSLRSRIYGRNRNSRNFRSWVLAKWLGPYMAERVGFELRTARRSELNSNSRETLQTVSRPSLIVTQTATPVRIPSAPPSSPSPSAIPREMIEIRAWAADFA